MFGRIGLRRRFRERETGPILARQTHHAAICAATGRNQSRGGEAKGLGPRMRTFSGNEGCGVHQGVSKWSLTTCECTRGVDNIPETRLGVEKTAKN